MAANQPAGLIHDVPAVSGPIVAPMTIVNRQYWEEIAGGLAEEGIQTNDKAPGQIAEEIAALCGLELPPDRRGGLRKGIDQAKTWLNHIRMGG